MDVYKTFKVLPYHIILEIVGEWIEVIYESKTDIFKFYGYFQWDITRRPFFFFRSIKLKFPLLFQGEKDFILKTPLAQKLYSLNITRNKDFYDVYFEIGGKNDNYTLSNNQDLLTNIFIPYNSYFRYETASHDVPFIDWFMYL